MQIYESRQLPTNSDSDKSNMYEINGRKHGTIQMQRKIVLDAGILEFQ